ncbi:PfkB family carbohydrate kinase [Lacticaseibacillus camelliae]
MRKDSAAANLTASQLPDLDLTATRVAHLTGIYAGVSATSRETLQALIGRLHQANVPISFDPNLRPALWPDEAGMRQTLNRLAQEATLVLPGLKEGRTLTGEETPEAIAQFYFDQSPRTKAVVIKLGSRGASFHTRVGAHGTVPGFVAERVVDTVGAGDGFALGVLTARLEGLDWAQATARGNAIGALGVQSPSDNDGYPDQAGLKQFIKTATRAVD